MRIDCDPQSVSPVFNFQTEKSLLALSCRGLFFVLLTACITLANTCRFTTKSAEVVELGASNTSSFDEIDVIDDGGVQRKDSFDANTETCLADGDRFPRAAMFTCNHDTFKNLQSLFSLGFLDPDVNADRVARLKLRNILS